MLDRRAPTIPYLDGWRGIAILSVLISHFGPRPAVGILGELGVQMFFALSGYLMGEVLFIKKPGLLDFFARRFSRIIPTFFLFVGCMYLYAQVQPRPFDVSFHELIATLTFLRTYTPDSLSIWYTGWAIGNIWSLNVEEHSYIFLAALALVARRMRSDRIASALLIASVLTSIAFFCLYWKSPPSGDKFWQLRSECAAVGLLCSATLRQLRGNHEVSSQRSTWYVVLTIITISALLIACFKLAPIKAIIVPMLLALAVNYLRCAPDKLKQFLSMKGFMWFGKRSFSLYLWQQPFFILVDQKLMSPTLGLGLGIAVGMFSFTFFEDPLRIKLNRAWTKLQQSKEALPSHSHALVMEEDTELLRERPIS